MTRERLASLGLALALLFVCASCWNGVHHSNIHDNAGGGARFHLLVEADRTDVDASHFLLDSATGDLWMLRSERTGPGAWIRIADGPADAKEFEEDEEEEEEG